MTTEVISYIDQGTVIDHIPAGRGLSIMRLLKLELHDKCVTLGMNLPSTHMGTKDLVKIEERELTPDEANRVSIYAPEATISIIRGHEVAEKFQVALPEWIHDCAPCPNKRCITLHEGMLTTFSILQQSTHTQLCCKYCQKTFTQDEIAL